jgi:2-keto-3-deoxy-galactonokinase
MELTVNYLRKLGFRRKRRKPETVEYLLDIPASHCDWVTIAIGKVEGLWVVKRIKTTGKIGSTAVSKLIKRSTISEVIEFAEFAASDQWPIVNWDDSQYNQAS